MIIFYSFCGSTEINPICNKNALFELVVILFLSFPTVDVKMQAVTVEPVTHPLW